MNELHGHTLSKDERLSSKTAIATLMSHGRWGSCAPLRFCAVMHQDEGQQSRILVSVPKKYFKRAVKRNLLKRRIRESYRLQKDMLGAASADIMFLWNSPEIADFNTVKAAVNDILKQVEGWKL